MNGPALSLLASGGLVILSLLKDAPKDAFAVDPPTRMGCQIVTPRPWPKLRPFNQTEPPCPESWS